MWKSAEANVAHNNKEYGNCRGVSFTASADKLLLEIIANRLSVHPGRNKIL